MNKSRGKPSAIHSWIVVLTASLFFFYEFIQMNMFNSLSTSFERAFTLSAFQVGLVSAFYFLSDSILLYPAGFLLDRISSKKLCLLGMVMCIAGTLMIAQAHNSWFLVVARFLAGSASAFALLSILRLASQWFPASKMGTASGVVVTIGMIGGAVSQTPLTILINHLGWRSALNWVAIFGVVILAFIVIIVKDAPKKYRFAHLQNEKGVATHGMLEALIIIMKNKMNWIIGLYICTMNLPIMILAGLFGTQYMMQARGFSNIQASSISMMIFIGTIFGSTLFGWLSDKMKSRRKPMLITAIMSLILFLFIMYAPTQGPDTYMVLFFFLGLITGAQIIGYPATQESNPNEMVGSALGFVSILIMGIPGILQPLVGYLVNLDWSGKFSHGVMVYPLRAYDLGLWVLVVGFIISIMCAYLMKETFNNGE